jgi:hypothetical protein
MKRFLKTIGTSLAVGALLLSGTIGWLSNPEVVSAAATTKAVTADQMISKVTAASKAIKNFHLDVIKKLDIQSGGMRISNTNTLKLDINRLPNFAAAGTIDSSLLESSYSLYANDKELYYLVDGSELMDESEDDSAGYDDDGEPIDPDAQYWIGLEKAEWDALYTKGQYDPVSMLDSVKNYKKSMKVSTAGAQTILQFTITDPTAAKTLIALYDQENLWDGETVQPKSVTWKLFVNTKTWQTEKLTVDLSYVLASDGEKDTYTTKIEAKYSKNNKGTSIVKPAELE